MGNIAAHGENFAGSSLTRTTGMQRSRRSPPPLHFCLFAPAPGASFPISIPLWLLGFVFYGEVEAGFGAGEGADDGGGGGFDGDGAGVGGGELESVEEDGGAFGVDAVAGEGSDEEGDGDLDGFDVFEWRQVEFEWCGFGQELGSSGCVGRGVGLVFDEDRRVFDQIFVAAVQ